MNELNKFPPAAGAVVVVVENIFPPVFEVDVVVDANNPDWVWAWVTLVKVGVFKIPLFPKGDFCCWIDAWAI